MNIPAPEKRKCQSCLNTMTLNLFSLNSTECRYCQSGLSIPSRLLNENDSSKPEDSSLQELNSSVPHEESLESQIDNELTLNDEWDFSIKQYFMNEAIEELQFTPIFVV